MDAEIGSINKNCNIFHGELLLTLDDHFTKNILKQFNDFRIFFLALVTYSVRSKSGLRSIS